MTASMWALTAWFAFCMIFGCVGSWYSTRFTPPVEEVDHDGELAV